MKSIASKVTRRIARPLQISNRAIVHGINRLQNPDDHILIDRVISSYHKGGGLKHRQQAYKLWSLMRLMEKYKPSKVLELGSGSSTSIFALYPSRLVSVDESPEWSGLSSAISGKEVVVRQKRVDVSKNPPEIWYEGEFEDDFDMVFIDGPSLDVDGKKPKGVINTNIFSLSPNVIVVDGRINTARAIVEKWSDKYDYRLSDLHVKTFVPLGYHYFSVFVRK